MALSPADGAGLAQQPGAAVHIFAPEQHDLYDGHFVISANRIYMVGGLNDAEGWDHLDNEAKTVRPVAGTAEIDVDETRNTGTFEARLEIPEGDLVLAMVSPCQDGGIAAYLHEHGADSGCGDDNWPKTFGFLAGWGYGHATLDGEPLYRDYEMHFMVTQGLRDRKTLRVNYPMADGRLPHGEEDHEAATNGARGDRAGTGAAHVGRHAATPQSTRPGEGPALISCARTGRQRAFRPRPVSSASRRSAGCTCASSRRHEPGESVSPAVAAHLERQDYGVPAAKPKPRLRKLRPPTW